MVITIFHIISIIGLISIILGTILISMRRKLQRRYTYPLLIIGGICLELYSIYIKDTIFIVLQGIFIISSIYGLIKLHEQHHKKNAL